jgi:hypothetical protein
MGAQQLPTHGHRFIVRLHILICSDHVPALIKPSREARTSPQTSRPRSVPILQPPPSSLPSCRYFHQAFNVSLIMVRRDIATALAQDASESLVEIANDTTAQQEDYWMRKDILIALLTLAATMVGTVATCLALRPQARFA